MWKLVFALGVTLALVCPGLSSADVGPPAHLQVTEQGAGGYTVQWRVPKALPPRAVPTPELPESCELLGEPSILDQAGAWLFEQDCACEGGLPGQALGMRYPFPDLALTTVIRVDLLSGDRFAHVLTPGDAAWRVPQGTAAPDILDQARRALLAGERHVLGSWVHVLFILVLGSLGGLREPIRLVSAFTLGQIVTVVGISVLGVELTSLPVEAALAVVVALLARQALRPKEERRRLGLLSVLAGLIHGLGIGALLAPRLDALASSLPGQIVSILGMDVVHLALALVVSGLWGVASRNSIRTSGRRPVLYGAGIVGMAMAVSFAAGGGMSAGVAESSLQLPAGSAGSNGAAGSRRVAPAAPNAPLQSFLTIEPFEARHEVMIRPAGILGLTDLDPASTLDVDAQPKIVEAIKQLVLLGTVFEADGVEIDPVFKRADFMSVSPTGALPRPNPVPEPMIDAVIGIVVAYPIAGIPEDAALVWRQFPGTLTGATATIIDPETVSSSVLTVEEPELLWTNELIEDPIPTVAAIEVEPSTVPVPWLSLPLVLLAGVILLYGFRTRNAGTAMAAARVILALAILVGPMVQTAVAVPGTAGKVPSERQARRILAGLLPNVYRALEFREEGMIYDRLSVSVTGETLSEVYLQQRRSLQMEERGGAQARVESVEVLELSEIQPQDSGFGVRAVWTVGGMVTHFGHRHFRQNRHDANITITEVDGAWKIQSLDVLDQERIR